MNGIFAPEVRLRSLLPEVNLEEVAALAAILADAAGRQDLDPSTCMRDLVAIWHGDESPEARADRHAREDVARRWLEFRDRSKRAELDARVFRARRWASSNAAALKPSGLGISRAA